MVRIKQYSCVKCSQNYSTKSNLNQHMKNVHNAENPNISDDVKINDPNEDINTKI